MDLASYTGSSYSIIGTTVDPFMGRFNGNNNIISNFTYDDNPSNTSYVGLFGYVKGSYARVKNLKLINANVKGYDNVVHIVD